MKRDGGGGDQPPRQSLSKDGVAGRQMHVEPASWSPAPRSCGRAERPSMRRARASSSATSEVARMSSPSARVGSHRRSPRRAPLIPVTNANAAISASTASAPAPGSAYHRRRLLSRFGRRGRHASWRLATPAWAISARRTSRRARLPGPGRSLASRSPPFNSASRASPSRAVGRAARARQRRAATRARMQSAWRRSRAQTPR